MTKLMLVWFCVSTAWAFRPLSVFNSSPWLLDKLSKSATPVAAYGLRKLRAGFVGNAIQVRRSSDSATQNIGFDAKGSLNTTTLSSFCGSGTCYVVTWYDQSGSGNNATQSTAANQPIIYSAGVLNQQNSLPAIAFQASSSTFMTLGSYPFSSSSTGSIHFVFRNNASANWARLFDFGASTTVNFFATPSSGTPDFRWRITTGGGGSEQGPTGGTVLDSSNHVLSFVHSGTAMTVWKDGTQVLNATGITIAPSAASGTLNYIGKSQYPDPYLNGNLQEILIFSSALGTADRQALERNQEQFFSVPGI